MAHLQAPIAKAQEFHRCRRKIAGTRGLSYSLQDGVMSSIYDNDIASMKTQKFGHLKRRLVSPKLRSQHIWKNHLRTLPLGEKLQGFNGT